MDPSPPLGPCLASDLDWLGYAPSIPAHDEILGADGEVRPHWRPFLAALRGLGRPELIRRWDEARYLIRENGVTYNVYGDPRGADRPWQLDPIPLLIAPAEAEALGAGLIQRGRLLEAILADLYGPQRLLTEGLIPPELVHANPAFLRPCHGAAVPGGRYLHFYAANLGRGSDGALWVLGDRTQAPSGAGYALENRIVLSRMLPDSFRECRVQRLALFFQRFRDTVRAIAPHNRDEPRVVLLTPGPFNETYFEHAFLARYLGYTLVQGGDLTVRDNRVHLKVLGGLQPVDAIVRRLDDDYCDPLEMRPDSFLGVPGLVQAVRSGSVAVANALGSGLLESAAFQAFLPRLARHLLGEDLRLPTVPTWWCGEACARRYVLDHLDELVIKPAMPGTRTDPIFGAELGRSRRDELAERIRSRPRDFVAQERLPLSTAPVLLGDRTEPRLVVLRAYLAAHDGSFEVMAGGLTRVGDGADAPLVSMQRGGGSKDTWVLSAGPVSGFSLLGPTGLPVALSRGGRDLPTRIADDLYWLGRYAERAEGLTRLLRSVLIRLTERSGLADVPELPALLRALTLLSECYPGFVGPGAAARLEAPEAEVLAIIHDARRSTSLASILRTMSRAADRVRDRISKDMWRVLRDLADDRGVAAPYLPHDGAADTPTATADPHRTLSEELERLDRAVVTLAAFGGLTMESVTRGDAWRFLDMGRKLERSLQAIGLLRRTLAPVAGPEGPVLEALLEVADSSMTYRRRYPGGLQAAGVLDLLLADESNPRSLAFQMVGLADHVEHLPRDPDRSEPGRSLEQRIMLSSLTALRLADADSLARVDDTGRRWELDDLLGRLMAALPALSDAITQTYLRHLQPSRHLAAGWDPEPWAGSGSPAPTC